MRQMAGYGQHHIMMGRIHDFNIGAKTRPERRKPLYIMGIGRIGRGNDAPAVSEQC